VTIEEIRGGDWGIGGKPMSAEAVKTLASARASA
jgi:hypothetical protein